jgi:hypothetical protein
MASNWKIFCKKKKKKKMVGEQAVVFGGFEPLKALDWHNYKKTF